MARHKWKILIQEIGKIHKSWKTQQAIYPYLCDFLIGLVLNRQDQFHPRVLSHAVRSSQTPYPQLYRVLQEFYYPLNDRIYVQDMVQRIVCNHLDVPYFYTSPTKLLFLDDPDVACQYNILHPKKLALTPSTESTSKPQTVSPSSRQCHSKSLSV